MTSFGLHVLRRVILDEFDPLRADPVPCEKRGRFFLAAAPGNQLKPRTLHRSQNAGPERDDPLGVFGKVVERTKRDESVRLRWQRGHRGRVLRLLKAGPRVRHADGFLERAGGVLPLRIEKGIGDAIVHRFETRRAGIAEPRDLHGRGLARESEQAVERGVQGEVHEDVDLIPPDLRREFFLRKIGRLAPSVGKLAVAVRDFVGDGSAAVAEELEAAPIVRLETRQQCPPHHMVPEIRRHVADAKLSIGRWIVGVRAPFAAERGRVNRIPSAHLVRDLGRWDRGMEEAGENEIAADLRAAGIQGHGASEAFEGGVDLAAVLQGDAEIVVGVEIVRRVGERGAVKRRGLIEPREILEEIPEIDGDRGIGGLLLQHLPIVRDCVVRPAGEGQRQAEVQPRGRVLRLEAQRGAVSFDGFVRTPHLAKGDSKIVVRFRDIRLQPDGIRKGRHRFLAPSEFRQQQAEIVVIRERARVCRDRTLDQFQRLVHPARLVRDHAEQLPEVRVLRGDCEQLPVNCLRLPNAPFPMMLEGDLERLLVGDGGHGRKHEGCSGRAWQIFRRQPSPRRSLARIGAAESHSSRSYFRGDVRCPRSHPTDAFRKAARDGHDSAHDSRFIQPLTRGA